MNLDANQLIALRNYLIGPTPEHRDPYLRYFNPDQQAILKEYAGRGLEFREEALQRIQDAGKGYAIKEHDVLGRPVFVEAESEAAAIWKKPGVQIGAYGVVLVAAVVALVVFVRK